MENQSKGLDYLEKSSNGNLKSPATIGSSVSIKGEITGEEDIVINGFVEGMINLKKNSVMVAKSGKVQAHIYGQVIHVEGEVTGNLFGGEQIVIHRSGNVKGNVTAPRVTIEDGARLKGSVDTDGKAETSILLKDSEVVRLGRTDDDITETLNGPSSIKRTPAVTPRSLS